LKSLLAAANLIAIFLSYKHSAYLSYFVDFVEILLVSSLCLVFVTPELYTEVENEEKYSITKCLISLHLLHTIVHEGNTVGEFTSVRKDLHVV
jgi:hypothetical protein